MKPQPVSIGHSLYSVSLVLRGFLRARIKLVVGCLGIAAALAGPVAQAQPVVDCFCVQQPAGTNACCGFIPDLCPVTPNCYHPAFFPPPGFTCVQSPPAGTLVCTSTLISVTFIENVTLKSNTC